MDRSTAPGVIVIAGPAMLWWPDKFHLAKRRHLQDSHRGLSFPEEMSHFELCENEGYIQSKQWDLNTYILRGIDDDAAADNDDDDDDATEFLLNFNPKMSNRRTG